MVGGLGRGAGRTEGTMEKELAPSKMASHVRQAFDLVKYILYSDTYR